MADSEVASYISGISKSLHVTNLPFCNKLDLENTGGDFWIQTIGILLKEKENFHFSQVCFYTYIIQNNISSWFRNIAHINIHEF